MPESPRPSSLRVKIRPAEAADAEVLTDFNRRLAAETEQRQLPESRVLDGVRNLLADPNAGFYLVAEHDGYVVGCLMVTLEWSDWRNGVFWWIQSVYVRQDSRRRGVFRTLYAHVRDRALKDANVCGIRLYVEHENRAAQATYESMGMRPTPYRMFEVEFEDSERGELN